MFQCYYYEVIRTRSVDLYKDNGSSVFALCITFKVENVFKSLISYAFVLRSYVEL